MESGIEIESGTRVFWVSPDELLFAAPTDDYVMQGTFRKRVSRVTTWNAGTKEVKRAGRVDGGLCYDRGNIIYWETDNVARRQWISSGRLGGTVTRKERALRYDEMTCLPFDALPQPPARAVEHEFVRLRPEHGFIDMGPHKGWPQNTQIHLYRPGSTVGIELPFSRRELKRGTIKYFPFKGAYFVESSYFDRVLGYETSPWPSGMPRPVWWLYPDGKVEEIIIPYAKWMSSRIVPTRAGLLAVDNTFFTITGEQPFDGVYLMSGKDNRRLLRGVFESSDVSENGCRFAVRRAPKPGAQGPTYWTVTVLSLCEEPK